MSQDLTGHALRAFSSLGFVLRMSTKDIMIELNIKENTLKFHNKNLYSKLGVSSRKQLLEVYRAIKSDMKKNGDKANVVI